MDHDAHLLRIGTFSTLSRISVRMLRHYQEHGVLEPARVDPFTGYRLYRADQLADAALAVALRDAGFAVEAIAQVVRVCGDPAQVEAILDAQREALSRRRDEVYAQLAALGRVSATLKGHPDMTAVTTTTLPAMTVACLRRIIPTYADEGLLWQELMPALARDGAALPADGVCGATFLDAEYRESDVDVEIWEQVAGPFPATAPVTCREEPAREVAMATLRGSYEQMPGATSALGAYVAEHGLRTGAMFNVYRVGPAQDPDPNAWVTDVCLPILRG